MTDGIQRRYRATYETLITLKEKSSGKVIKKSRSKDISLNGMFVETTDKLEEGTVCILELLLPNTKDKTVVTIECVVARSSDEGFGITFENMDITSYEHLKNIVIYNSDNPHEVLEQCEKRPGFK
jgi:c-di-GMP-binding flagellar brake protein YcgR